MQLTKKIVFKNKEGLPLAGALELPQVEPSAFAIFAHCFTCSKNTSAASRISSALAKKGIAVLRFDFTGLGSSGGDFENTNFSSNIQDLLSAADYLKNQFDAPQILIGHSLGGAAVFAASKYIPSVRAIATMGAPSDPSHVKHLFAENISEIEQSGEAKVVLAGRNFTIKKQFLEDIQNQNLVQSLALDRRAVLFFHSPIDQYVSIDHAKKLYEAAKHPKSFISLDQADHLLTKKEDAEYVATTLAAWASRYVDKKETSPTQSTIVQERDQAFARTIYTNGHTIYSDEPLNFGGTNSGPTPYDLLLASLGSCTSMTIRMYANRKKWPLKDVEIKLEQKKIHAKDCENCESKSGKIDHIWINISLQGELSQEQKQRLLEIAHKCPIHQTLVKEKVIEVQLIDVKN